MVCFDEMKHIFRYKILNFLTFYPLSDIAGTPAFDIQRRHHQILIKTIGSPETAYEKPIGCFSQRFFHSQTVGKNSQSAFHMLFKKMTTQAGG